MVLVAVEVALALAGLAVLGALSLRLWRQVRLLAHDLRAAGERLSGAVAALEQASAGPATAAGPPGSSSRGSMNRSREGRLHG